MWNLINEAKSVLTRYLPINNIKFDHILVIIIMDSLQTVKFPQITFAKEPKVSSYLVERASDQRILSEQYNRALW